MIHVILHGKNNKVLGKWAYLDLRKLEVTDVWGTLQEGLRNFV
jgi:hypothetical protein